MKLIIESTTKIVKLNGIDCRVWEGHTDRGIQVHCFIPRVAVRDGLDTSQFDQELAETAPIRPSPEVEGIPNRMLL